MKMNEQGNIIQEAIVKVEHPAIATTLLDLGMLKDITVTPDGKIDLALVLHLPNITEDMLFDQNGQPSSFLLQLLSRSAQL